MRIAIRSLALEFCSVTPLLATLALLAAGLAPAHRSTRTCRTPSSPCHPRWRSRPNAMPGNDVIWGGRIVQVQNYADHSEVELLAYPLDSSQRPQVATTVATAASSP
jgi:outer membrane lipoprotein